MEGYLAEIRFFAGNFAPRGWFFCQGQLLPIAQWTALFALLGTTYGGNGQTTFGLPDCRGRVDVGTFQGPGLQNVILGEQAGEPSHTLSTGEMPNHNHQIHVNNNLTGMVPTAVGGFLNSKTESSESTTAAGLSGDAFLNVGTISPTGSNLPHENMQPYLGMNFIICAEGIFPSRN